MGLTSAVHARSPLGGGCGLRERKKQRTRDALIEAAFDLFARKGFESTTVEEIADAVEVSSRTFFRYFASKEEVALSPQDDMFGALLAALAARPAGEPALTAVRRAAVEILRDAESGSNGFDSARFQCIQVMMSATPALYARSFERSTAIQSELVAVLAARMGADPATDLRPHLVAGLALCGIRSGVESFLASNPALSLSETFDRACALLAEGVDYPAVGVSATGTATAAP
jgi:AcrR family transcriptional regulator